MALTTYVTPQTLVYQEFNQTPNEIADALRALIAGPNAFLLRHGVESERLQASVGTYNPSDDNIFPWPGRPLGAEVDEAFVRVFIDNARLQFFSDLAGEDETVTPVAGFKDRVAIGGVHGFRANGTWPRIAALGDRDVQVDDRVHVRGVNGGVNYAIDTYVRGITAERTAAVTGPAVPDGANWGTQAGAATVALVAGTANDVTLTATIAGYSAYPTGDLHEVYTVTVTQGSIGGDFTTALVRVTSASGHDDQAQVQPAAAGAAFTVGARGLQLTFGHTAAGDLVVGQTWHITVDDNYTVLAGTSGGTYAGDSSTTYVFECIRGGSFADPDPASRPIMRAYTTTGVDSAVPVTLNLAATAYPVGTQGVTFTFTGAPGGVARGDKFYVAVTAAQDGRMSTLILGHDLPTGLVGADDLDLILSVTRDIQVDRTTDATERWTAETQQLVLRAGLFVEDEDFTTGGVPTPLEVTAGDVFVEYRAWLQDLVGEVGTISDVGQIDAAIPGALDPSNPLKWGVYKTLSNANGTQVKFTAVADPASLASWTDMLGLLIGRDDVYNIVPLTHDREVQDAVAAHCDAQSSPEQKAWRACIINLKAVDRAAVLDQSSAADGRVVMGRILDDPNQTGTQNVLVTLTSGNGGFVAAGTRPGDELRTNFALDDYGKPTWDVYTIDEVLNETSLLLVDGPIVPISVPQKIEVWHVRTKAEIAEDLAAYAGSFASRRVKAVWPDTVGSAGVQQEGYFLCCALAGLRSGVVPHQGLTNLEIAGFDDLSRTTKYLNGTQLNVMAQAGAWIVTQDHTGTVFTRHALTTDRSSVETSEEMVTSNLDSISYLYARNLARYIGLMNVTDDALLILQAEINAIIGYLRATNSVPRLGPQVISATITSIQRHPFLPDRVVAIVNHVIPFPLNNLELHIVI